MSQFQLSGKLYSATQTEQKTDTFSVRTFILEVSEAASNGQVYTNHVQFQLVNKNCGLIDSFGPGQPVTISFNVTGRLYENKAITNLNAWKIEAQQAQQFNHPPQPQQAAPQQQAWGGQQQAQQQPPAQTWGNAPAPQPAPPAQSWGSQPQQQPPAQPAQPSQPAWTPPVAPPAQQNAAQNWGTGAPAAANPPKDYLPF